jgi:hypothetical protein
VGVGRVQAVAIRAAARSKNADRAIGPITPPSPRR